MPGDKVLTSRAPVDGSKYDKTADKSERETDVCVALFHVQV